MMSAYQARLLERLFVNLQDLEGGGLRYDHNLNLQNLVKTYEIEMARDNG